MKLASRILMLALCLSAMLPAISASLSRPSSRQEQSNRIPELPSNQFSSFKDDFSVQRWGVGPSSYGNIWYQNNEYHMHATRGGFIVMYGPDPKEYSTENATVAVTVRSVYESSPTTGYGMVVHGEKNTGQLEDYGFLIYTGQKPQYKIVLHKKGVEKVLVDWVPSDAIHMGVRPNRMEVRNRDQKLEFYINGQYLTTISDSEGWMRGVVGLYTTQTNDIAFDDLEIIRDSTPSQTPTPAPVKPQPRTGSDEASLGKDSGSTKPDYATLEPVTTKTDLYPADADAKKQIDEALKQAAADRKRVLLVFGGNWCYDCHVLDRALHEGAAGKVVKESFLIVHVDIGEGHKNLDLVQKYKTTLDKGVPVVVILSANGSLLYGSDDGEFEAARRMMKKDLVAFLNRWKDRRR